MITALLMIKQLGIILGPGKVTKSAHDYRVRPTTVSEFNKKNSKNDLTWGQNFNLDCKVENIIA